MKNSARSTITILILAATVEAAIGESGPFSTMYSMPQAKTSMQAQRAPAAANATASAGSALPAEFQGAEVAVILNRGQFVPSTIKLRTGMRTRLVFATTNSKPGALVVEGMNLQRWVPNQEPTPQKPPEKLEIEREIASDRVTEVIFEPVAGNFLFHDALSGARGEIIVE